MFLRRSLAQGSYMYMIFFSRYIWGSCPPPPLPYQKAGYATADQHPLNPHLLNSLTSIIILYNDANSQH